MDLPDDILEKAARAEYEADQIIGPLPPPEYRYAWHETLPSVRQAYVDRVKAALAVILPAHRVLVAEEIAKALDDEGEFAVWHERNGHLLWPTNLETVQVFVAERFAGRKPR